MAGSVANGIGNAPGFLRRNFGSVGGLIRTGIVLSVGMAIVGLAGDASAMQALSEKLVTANSENVAAQGSEIWQGVKNLASIFGTGVSSGAPVVWETATNAVTAGIEGFGEVWENIPG